MKSFLPRRIKIPSSSMLIVALRDPPVIRASSPKPSPAFIMAICTSFALGAGLSGFGGALVAPVMAIHPVMGILLVLKCFAAVIMGGFGNIKGTIYSAFILAIVESFAVAYLSLQYKDVFAFVVMIIILLFKPHGMFGRKVGI